MNRGDNFSLEKSFVSSGAAIVVGVLNTSKDKKGSAGTKCECCAVGRRELEEEICAKPNDDLPIQEKNQF